MEVTGQPEHIRVLVFEVDGRPFGVELDHVRELLRAVMPASLPGGPRVIAGIINLRGEAVPLLDLRVRFGLARAPLAASEVFVVLRARRPLAIRSDRARGIVQVERSALTPIAATAARAEHAAGTLLLPDGALVLVDVERFLDEAELLSLREALGAQTGGAAC